jgi:hypothetical protein
MKVATIFYHKNIKYIYKKEWIDDCVNSIINQSFKDFSIYELNYGDDKFSLINEYDIENEHHSYQIKFDNHAEAMNFLLDECLLDGVDVVFNNNMDDYSDVKRFEIQLEKIKEGYDLISSNFKYIDIDSKFIRDMKMSHHLDYSSELSKGHNIIAHPSVCYSRNFLENNKYIPGEIPEEDLKLWQRSVNKQKFYICDEFLLNYRIHDNQVTKLHEEEKMVENFLKKSKKIDVDTTDVPVDKPDVIIDIPKPVKKRKIFNIEPVTVRKDPNNCRCGEPKNKIRYNFCQKCNKLY